MKDLTPVEMKLDLRYTLTPLEREVQQRTGVVLPLAFRRFLPQNRSKELVVASALKYQATDFKGAFICANEALQLWAENKEAWVLDAAALAAAPDDERRQLFLHPGNMFLSGPKLKFWNAWLRLPRGEYTHEVWECWEDRLDFWGARTVDRASYWDGKSSLTGKTLFLDMDGGHGDNLMFGRCAPIAKAAGARVVVMLDKYSQRIAPLLRLCSSIDEIVPVDVRCRDNVPPHDVALPASSFPLVLDTTTENIPEAHWLPDPPKEKRERAKAKISEGGFKIGLSWASSEKRRNLPLRSFAVLATIPGVRLFALQRGAEAMELEGIDFDITSLESEDTDILDTAAAMCEMDLIISADTMTCHLAGALGRPVWVLLMAHCDWRWMQTRSDTPWYPTMRLFRQSVQDDWSGPVADVVAAVREMIGPPTVPTAD